MKESGGKKNQTSREKKLCLDHGFSVSGISSQPSNILSLVKHPCFWLQSWFHKLGTVTHGDVLICVRAISTQCLQGVAHAPASPREFLRSPWG